MKERSETWKLIIVAVAVVMATPGVLSMNTSVEEPLAPCCPPNVWGYAYFGSVPMEGKTLLAQIDGVSYGMCQTYFNGTYPAGIFTIDIWGDDTTPDNVKTGGEMNDLIVFAYTEGDRTYFADFTTTWIPGRFNVYPINFTFSPDWPFQLKINEICTDDGSGLQYVYIFNPSTDPVDLGEYYFEKDTASGYDGDTFPLSGTVGPQSDIRIELGSTGFINTTGDELKLVFDNANPNIAGGHDIVVDRVEFGNIPTEPENTTMPNAAAPPAGWSIKRVPDGMDTDDCSADFRLRWAVQTYYIPVDTGPNLVSLPLEVEDECILCVLSSVNWLYAEWYDAFNDTDHWKTHLRFRPMVLNDLRAIDHTMGFWLTVPFPQALAVTGNVTASTTIPLRAGWNYVGYPSLSTRPVSMALAGTGYDAVEGFDGNAPYRLSPLSDSYIMKPGEGYRVHVPADVDWVVDW